jgi:hypothetical protein
VLLIGQALIWYAPVSSFGRFTLLRRIGDDASAGQTDRSGPQVSSQQSTFGNVASMLGPVLVAFLILQPMLKLGFIADDLMMSVLGGMLGLQHRSVWGEILHQIEWWIQTEGRFFPLPFIYSYLFFANSPSMYAEKLVQFTIILINVATLFGVARYIVGRQVASVIAFIFVACLQVRTWFDAILAFFILLPLTCEMLLLCLWCWLISLERRSRLWALGGLACGVFALLSYEMSYLIVVAIGASCCFARGSRRWKIIALAGNAAPVAILSIVDATLRSHFQVTAYAISWDAVAYAKTFVEQFVAALPLSYAIFTEHANVFQSLVEGTASTYASGVLTSAFLLFAFRRIGSVSRSSFLTFATFGFALWVFPAATISLSHAIQTRPDHSLGNGYLNVYLETAGIAILCGTVLATCLAAIRSSTILFNLSCILASLLVGVLVDLTGTRDRMSMEAFMPMWTTNRAEMDRAFSSGLLLPVARDAAGGPLAIYWDAIYPIAAESLPSLIYADSHEATSATFVDRKMFQGDRLCKLLSPAQECTVRTPPWLLEVTPDSRIVAVRVAAIRQESNGIAAPITDRWYLAGNGREATTAVGFGLKTVRTVGVEPIYEVSDCIGVPASDATSYLPPSNVLFGDGFSVQETSGDSAWRWGGAHSVFQVSKFMPRRALVQVQMRIMTLGSTRVVIDTPGRSLNLQTRAKMETPVTLPIDMRRTDQATIRITVAGDAFHTAHDRRELAIKVSALGIRATCEP